jgi:hypothetical protein
MDGEDGVSTGRQTRDHLDDFAASGTHPDRGKDSFQVRAPDFMIRAS